MSERKMSETHAILVCIFSLLVSAVGSAFGIPMVLPWLGVDERVATGAAVSFSLGSASAAVILAGVLVRERFES